MKISEVEPEKKIVISKVEFVCDLIDDSIPKPLFQNYNSFLVLTAPRHAQAKVHGSRTAYVSPVRSTIRSLTRSILSHHPLRLQRWTLMSACRMSRRRVS